MNKRLPHSNLPAAIIFDMDGTLIDSTEADYLAWKKLFAEYSVTLTYEQYFSLLGIRSADIVQKNLQLEGAAVTAALARKLFYFKEVIERQGINTIPHAAELVAYIRNHNIKMALATSSRREKMKMVMEQTGLLQYFDIIVTGEEVTHGKPAPEIFLTAANRLGVAASGCIVFEDAASGVQAAKHAAMQCIAITTTHPAALLHKADLIINSFEELDKSALYCQPAGVL